MDWKEGWHEGEEEKRHLRGAACAEGVRVDFYSYTSSR